MRHTHILYWIGLLVLAGMVRSAAKLKGCCIWNNKYMNTNSRITRTKGVNTCSAFCSKFPFFGIRRNTKQCFCFKRLDQEQSDAKRNSCWRKTNPRSWKIALLALYEIQITTPTMKPVVVTRARPTIRTAPERKNSILTPKPSKAKKETTTTTTAPPYKIKITSIKHRQTLTTQGAIPLKTTVRTSKAGLLRSTSKVGRVTVISAPITAISDVQNTDLFISTTHASHQISNSSVSTWNANFGLTNSNRTQLSEKIREILNVHGANAEQDMSRGRVAEVSQSDKKGDTPVVPVAAGVGGGLVLILALIVGLVIGQRRHNIFQKSPAKSSNTPKRYNNPTYSTQETFNGKISSVQATVIGLSTDETDVYYSQVSSTTSVERAVGDIDKEESLYYEAETVYENSTAEASYPPQHPGTNMDSDYEGTDIYCIAEAIEDDLVVVDNDLYGS